MDSFLVCSDCQSLFNDKDKLPKILPCSDVMCLNCIKKNSEFYLGEFLLKCYKCFKKHNILSLEDIPTSSLTLDYIKNIQNKQNFVNLKKFNLNQKQEIYEINKHYDNIINSIDIRTESLINFLCASRELLLEQVNELRKKSIQNFDTEISNLKNSLENGLSDMENTSVVEKIEIKNILNNYDKLETIKHDIKNKLWYFDENPIKNDKSMIGFILNKNLDRNYLKIKNLSSYFKKDGQEECKIVSNAVRITFKSPNNYAETAIRQNVIPISRNRIIKVYFTTKRSLLIESFDSNGKFLKSTKAFENLSSFPISYAYGDHFCLSFTAKTPSNTSLFDSNQTFVLLFNTNLQCLKTVNKFTSVESLYMNEKNIIIFYAHKTSACCEILDYNLNEIESLGQQTDPDKEFYMEKTNLAWKEQTNSGIKNNPRIFGFTETLIYFFNINNMVIMDRKTGEIKKKIESNGDPAYYLLDSQSNIIKVNSLCKRISLFNYDHDLFAQNKYLDCFDDVFLTIDDYLTFVDKNKEFVIFI